ncbi:MAG: hypothetical protein KJO43_01245 [Phycisphaerae bacterium]|nr:hypothetical protein [Phycisphaerae bacterium]
MPYRFNRTTGVISFVGSLLMLSGPVDGDFIGGHADRVVDSGAPPCSATWRFYIDFTEPTDALLSIGGIPDLAPFHLVTHDVAGILNDGGPFAGTMAEDFPGLGASWDSWLTIGTDTFPPGVGYSPGFGGVPTDAAAVVGSVVHEDNGGLFTSVPPPPPSVRTAFGWSTLVAQLTVRDDACVQMSGTVSWAAGSAEAGFTSSIFLLGPLTCFDCSYDLDDDGVVDFLDLLTLLAAWGSDFCEADVDASGLVDFSDLLGLLAAWGSCTD